MPKKELINKYKFIAFHTPLQEGTCHQGTKCSKVTFLDNGKLLTTGFSRYSDRQYSIWDQHDLKNPLHQEVMDSSSGVVTPYFDYDTRMVCSLILDFRFELIIEFLYFVAVFGWQR